MFNICNYKSLINELKCKQCSKVLSVLPVYYCSAVGNICGRCTSNVDWMISNGTMERAVAYEAVAKFLVFPCCNYEHGCEAKLNHKDVVQHEQQCKSLVAPCPFNLEFERLSMKCDWQGTAKTLAQHLQSNHNDYLQVGLPSFVMNVYDTHIKVFFTTVDNITFFVVTQYIKETNKFYCIVVCCEKAPEHLCYRYQLEVGRYNDYFLILRKPDTEAFSNVQDIINNQDKMIAIDVSSIHTMINDSNSLIHCKISITKKGKKEITSITGSKSTTGASKPPDKPVSKPKVLAKTDDKTIGDTKVSLPTKKSVPLPSGAKKQATPQKMQGDGQKTPLELSKLKIGETSSNSSMSNSFLKELECPICFEFMVPPIYICPTGHSICSSCRTKIQFCALCRFPLQETRNFSLENMAVSFKYPCKYKEYGCNTSLTYEHIRMHELHCMYAYGRCPLKLLALCNATEDIVDLIGHLREKHATYMVETNRQYSRELAGKIASSYWVTVFENQIFIICCKHSSAYGPIKFNILHVGMNATKPKYKFELQFCDQTGNGLKLIVSQLCQAYPSNPSSGLKNCLMIPQDLLQPFMIRRAVPKVFFKFYIQKL